MKKNAIWLFAGVVLAILLMWQIRGTIPTITPGQELRAQCITDEKCGAGFTCVEGQCVSGYPKEGNCSGRAATLYGLPAFETADPAMPHMLGMPCSNNDQCLHWPPTSAKGAETECCMNTGVCIIYK
jgi:hypothetical protein